MNIIIVTNIAMKNNQYMKQVMSNLGKPNLKKLTIIIAINTMIYNLKNNLRDLVPERNMKIPTGTKTLPKLMKTDTTNAMST